MDEFEAAGPPGLLDLAILIAENLRSLIIIPAVAGVLALGATYLVDPTYTATARILPPAQQQSTSAALAAQMGALAGLVGATGVLKNPADQYVSLLKSRTVYDEIINHFDLKHVYSAEYLEDARKALERRSKIYAGAKDGLITIEVEDDDPKRAADIANAFIEELRDLSKTLAISEAAQRRLFFENQVAQAKANLASSELALRGSGISEAAMRVMPQSALEGLARLKAQITAQEIKIASMSTFMTDANPDFKLAFQELAALRSELARLDKTNASGPKGQGAEYISKFRNFKYHETLFELVAKQYELARLDEAREGAVIQVVEAATPPERRSRPRRTLITALITAGGLLLVLGVIYARAVIQQIAANPSGKQKLQRLGHLLRLR